MSQKQKNPKFLRKEKINYFLVLYLPPNSLENVSGCIILLFNTFCFPHFCGFSDINKRVH